MCGMFPEAPVAAEAAAILFHWVSFPGHVCVKHLYACPSLYLHLHLLSSDTLVVKF